MLLQGDSQDFRKGGGGGGGDSPVSTKNNFIALFLLSFWICSAPKIITTGLDAIIMVPYISLCLGLVGAIITVALINRNSIIISDLSSYFHMVLCCWIPVLVSLSTNLYQIFIAIRMCM